MMDASFTPLRSNPIDCQGGRGDIGGAARSKRNKDALNKKKAQKDARNRARNRSGDRKKSAREKERKAPRRDRKKKKSKSFFGSLRKKFVAAAVDDVKIQLNERAHAAAEEVGLSRREITKIRFTFDQIDLDGSGEVDYDEFFEAVDEQRSPFTDALFLLIDEDQSGEIDFNEFVAVMCTYCMYTQADILKFAFETFDKDGSGSIDEEEFMDLCKTINAMNPTFPGNFGRALQEFDTNDDGLIDFDEFKEINKRYPLVLFPAFRLQDRMQKATLGEWGWAAVQRRLAKRLYIQEYKRQHDGALPPEPFFTRMVRNCLGQSREGEEDVKKKKGKGRKRDKKRKSDKKKKKKK